MEAHEISFALLMVILGVELVSMLIGLSTDHLFGIDTDAGADVDLDVGMDIASVVFNWLEVGRVPILMWVSALLAWFTVFSFTTQTVSSFVSLPFSLVAAVIGAKFTARILGKVIPKIETESLRREDLTGLSGSITFYSQSRVEATVKDRYGTLHYLPVKCSSDLQLGDEVTIIEVTDSGISVERR